MKRALLVVMALVLVASFAFAADAPEAPKAQIFGGYQYTRIDTGGLTGNINANGWNAALTGNFTKHLGITADFSGAYKDGGHMYSYLFGPQVSGAMGKARPFAHVLFGANTIGGSGTSSDSGWAMAFGGGLDVSASKVVAIRLGQFDYLRTNHFSTGLNNFRYSAGLVLNF